MLKPETLIKGSFAMLIVYVPALYIAVDNLLHSTLLAVVPGLLWAIILYGLTELDISRLKLEIIKKTGHKYITSELGNQLDNLIECLEKEAVLKAECLQANISQEEKGIYRLHEQDLAARLLTLRNFRDSFS